MDQDMYKLAAEISGYVFVAIFILINFVVDSFLYGHRIKKLERQVDLLSMQKVTRDSVELMKEELKPQLGDK